MYNYTSIFASTSLIYVYISDVLFFSNNSYLCYDSHTSICLSVAAALKISTQTICKIRTALDRGESLSIPRKSRPYKKAKTEDLIEGRKIYVRKTWDTVQLYNEK